MPTDLSFSADSKHMAVSCRDGIVNVLNLKTREEKSYPHQQRIDSASFSPDGKSLLTASGFGDVYLLSLADGSQKKLFTNSRFAQFTPDGNAVIGAEFGNELVIKQLDAPDSAENNTTTSLKVSGTTFLDAFMFKNRKTILAQTRYNTILLQATGSSWQDTSESIRDISHHTPISSTNRIIGVDGRHTAQLIDIETGQRQEIPSCQDDAAYPPAEVGAPGVFADGSHVLLPGSQKSLLRDLKTICVSPNLKVMQSSCVANCDVASEPTLEPALLHAQQAALPLRLATLCSAPFSPGEWDRLAPMPRANEMTEDEARIFLKRFQKR